MLRLGGDHVVTIGRTDPVTKVRSDVRISYRAPTSDEVNQYIAETVTAKSADSKDVKSIMEKRLAMCVALIKEVDGVEAELGYSAIETLRQWGSPILLAFATYVFEGGFGTEVSVPDPGKPSAPSAPPSRAASARSSAKGASGSSK